MVNNQSSRHLAPDGGWGYVCIVAVFVLQCIFGMVVRSFGLLYLLLLERYNTSATAAAWVGAVNLILYGLLGPVSSVLCARFQHRTVAMTGCSLQAIGFVLTGYAPNMVMVFVGFGICVGMGNSMTTVSGLLMIDRYFHKKKSMATSVSASGIGVTMFVFPPLINFLMDQYGYQGTMLMLSGICLQGVVVSMLLRPLEYSTQKHLTMVKIVSLEQKSCLEDYEMKVSKTGTNESESEGLHTDKNESETGHEKQQDESDDKNEVQKDSISETESQKKHNKISQIKQESTKDTERLDSETQANSVILLPLKDNTADIKTTLIKEINETSIIKTSGMSKLRPYIDLARTSPAVCGMLLLMLTFTLLDSCVYSFLPALAIEHGLRPTDAKFLISWAGISDTFHRIAYGFLMDLRLVKPRRIHLYCTLALLAAVITVLYPFCNLHALFVVAVVIFGGCSGVVFAQRVTITSDLAGAEHTPLMFGVIIALNAVGHSTGRAIGGVIRDVTGSYHLLFYLSGSLAAFSALVFFSLLIVCKPRRQT